MAQLGPPRGKILNPEPPPESSTALCSPRNSPESTGPGKGTRGSPEVRSATVVTQIVSSVQLPRLVGLAAGGSFPGGSLEGTVPVTRRVLREAVPCYSPSCPRGWVTDAPVPPREDGVGVVTLVGSGAEPIADCAGGAVVAPVAPYGYRGTLDHRVRPRMIETTRNTSNQPIAGLPHPCL